MIPIYTIFAGVNGAGKSTFYRILGSDFGVRINTDEIIREKFNNDWKNPKAQFESGKIAVKLIRECINNKISFNQETTLTGHAIISNINSAKLKSFRISLFYVGSAEWVGKPHKYKVFWYLCLPQNILFWMNCVQYGISVSTTMIKFIMIAVLTMPYISHWIGAHRKFCLNFSGKFTFSADLM